MEKLYEVSLLRVELGSTEEKNNNDSDFCDVDYKNGKYIIKSNFKNYRKSVESNNRKVKVCLNDKKIPQIREELLSRLSKEKINPMMMAIYYEELNKVIGLKQRQVADILNITQGAISNKRRLITLPRNIQQMIIDEEIKERHGRAILRLKNLENYEQKANDIVKQVVEQNLNVAKTEELIDDVLGIKKGTKQDLRILHVENKEFKGEEQIVIRHIQQQMDKVMKNIEQYFPNLEISYESGLDKDDYIYLLKLKGINNHD